MAGGSRPSVGGKGGTPDRPGSRPCCAELLSHHQPLWAMTATGMGEFDLEGLAGQALQLVDRLAISTRLL